MKIISIVLTVTVFTIALTLLYIATSYRGPTNFKHTATVIPHHDKVTDNARTLLGTLYDPLMGMYENVGGKLGFVVCSDIPNIAYGLAGYSFQTILEHDYQTHQSFYDIANGNKPDNPYFHRRARNLFAYFKANNRLASASYSPQPGDLAFYRKPNQRDVTHVALVSKLTGNDYYLIESAPKTVVVSEVPSQSPIKRGWKLLGFGKMNIQGEIH